MILDAIISALVSVLNGIYGLLPNWNWFEMYDKTTYDRGLYAGADPFPADMNGYSFTSNPVVGLISIVSEYNMVLPVYEALILVNAVITFSVAYGAFRGVVWLVGVVRGSGTSA